MDIIIPKRCISGILPTRNAMNALIVVIEVASIATLSPQPPRRATLKWFYRVCGNGMCLRCVSSSLYQYLLQVLQQSRQELKAAILDNPWFHKARQCSALLQKGYKSRAERSFEKSESYQNTSPIEIIVVMFLSLSTMLESLC